MTQVEALVMVAHRIRRHDYVAVVEGLHGNGVEHDRHLGAERLALLFRDRPIDDLEPCLGRSPGPLLDPTFELRPIDLREDQAALDLVQLHFGADPFQETVSRILFDPEADRGAVATLHEVDKNRKKRRDRKSTRLNSSHSQISYA